MKRSLIPVVKLPRIAPFHAVRMMRATLGFSRDDTTSRLKPALTLEAGSGFLLETGGRLLLEKDGTKSFDHPIISPGPAICLESGRHLLLENGAAIVLENNQS